MLMDRCLPSIARQTYTGPIEVCLVSDGRDYALDDQVHQLSGTDMGAISVLHYNSVPGTLNHAPRWGNYARKLALEMAQGDFIAYLDDDDAYRPRHVEVLAGALTSHPEAQFAWSKMATRGMHTEAETGPEYIGGPQLGPTLVGTPMIMHRATLVPDWGPPDEMEDWKMIEKWVIAKVRGEFVDEVTIDVWPQAYRGFGEDEI